MLNIVITHALIDTSFKGEFDNKLKSANKIDLVNCEKGKYFRLVCSISYDDKDLTKTLLDKHYGVAYYGDTKEKVDWCKFQK